MNALLQPGFNGWVPVPPEKRFLLSSLELAFAVIASADSGKPVVPGKTRRVGDSCKPKD